MTIKELCEKLGCFISQGVNGKIKEIEIIYSGELAEIDNLEILTRTVIQGAVNPFLSSPVNAVNAAIENGEAVTRETFETYLDTGDLLPIDLMVRTSNENRISNFLLWKLAYAELLFLPEHWPDLVKNEKLWQYTLEEFTKRNRRFGGGKKANYSGKKK